MRNEIIFDDKQKVMNLTLEELQATADYVGERKHTISHHKLFSDLLMDLSNRGFEAQLDQLFISKNGIINPTQLHVDRQSDLNSVNDINGVIIRNCIGKINISGPEFDDGDTNQQIAISYNKAGVAMSMGANVSICSNMSIFGGQMVSNYGQSSMPMMRMLEIMASWIQNMKMLRLRDLAIHKFLKERVIDPIKEVDEVIGNLHRLVEMNLRDNKVIAPLSHSRIHDIQRGIMDNNGIPMASAYDFFMAATNVSTHQNVIENRLPNSSALGLYFQNRYDADNIVEEIVAETAPVAIA